MHQEKKRLQQQQQQGRPNIISNNCKEEGIYVVVIEFYEPWNDHHMTMINSFFLLFLFWLLCKTLYVLGHVDISQEKMEKKRYNHYFFFLSRKTLLRHNKSFDCSGAEVSRRQKQCQQFHLKIPCWITYITKNIYCGNVQLWCRNFKRTKMFQNVSNFVQIFQILSKFFKFCPNFQILSKFFKFCPNFSNFVQIFQILSK